MLLFYLYILQRLELREQTALKTRQAQAWASLCEMKP